MPALFAGDCAVTDRWSSWALSEEVRDDARAALDVLATLDAGRQPDSTFAIRDALAAVEHLVDVADTIEADLSVPESIVTDLCSMLKLPQDASASEIQQHINALLVQSNRLTQAEAELIELRANNATLNRMLESMAAELVDTQHQLAACRQPIESSPTATLPTIPRDVPSMAAYLDTLGIPHVTKGDFSVWVFETNGADLQQLGFRFSGKRNGWYYSVA